MCPQAPQLLTSEFVSPQSAALVAAGADEVGLAGLDDVVDGTDVAGSLEAGATEEEAAVGWGETQPPPTQMVPFRH